MQNSDLLINVIGITKQLKSPSKLSFLLLFLLKIMSLVLY